MYITIEPKRETHNIDIMKYAKCSKCGNKVFGKTGKWSKHWRCMDDSEKRVNKKSGHYRTTLDELVEEFPDLMQGDIKAKGFSIGNGSKLYWYISPSGKTGKYRCLPIENNGLGWPVYYYPEKKVTVHYE